MSDAEYQLKRLSYSIIRNINTLINTSDDDSVKKELRLAKLIVAHELEVRLKLLSYDN